MNTTLQPYSQGHYTILVTVPHFGTKKIGGRTCLKVSDYEQLFSANGWDLVKKSNARSPYDYWAPPEPLPHGARPVVELSVPTAAFLNEVVKRVHQAGVERTVTHNSVSYTYRPHRTRLYVDDDGQERSYPEPAFFFATRWCWDVYYWIEEDRWKWWGKGATYWHRVPDADSRILFRWPSNDC